MCLIGTIKTKKSKIRDNEKIYVFYVFKYVFGNWLENPILI